MTVIIDIDHETGDLSEWTNVSDTGGDLSASNLAGLAGTSFGLACRINDTQSFYAFSQVSDNTSGVMRIRFYFDPNSITMADDSNHFIGVLRSNTNIANIKLQWTTADGYGIQAQLVGDSATLSTAYYPIADAEHYIEIQLTRSTNSTSNDGTLDLWIDGAHKEQLVADNFDMFPYFRLIRLGATSGVDGTTSGTYYFDEIIVNDDGSEIGAVGGGGTATDLTVQDATHAHASDSIALTVNAQLAVTDAAHVHASDAIALFADSFLSVQDAEHAHSSDAIALSATSVLSIDGVTHEHTADTIVLTAQSHLSVTDATHEHTTDTIGLTVTNYLIVADATHEHVVDSIELTTEGNTDLTVNDATHNHAADIIALTANSVLSVQDATHMHSADGITLTLGFSLAVMDAAHIHTADAIALVTDSYLVVADARHIHVTDSIVLGGVESIMHYIYVIAAESRTYIIPAETVQTITDRTFTIATENRTMSVPHD